MQTEPIIVGNIRDVEVALGGLFLAGPISMDPQAGLQVSILSAYFGNGFLPLQCDAQGKLIISGTVSTTDVSALIEAVEDVASDDTNSLKEVAADLVTVNTSVGTVNTSIGGVNANLTNLFGYISGTHAPSLGSTGAAAIALLCTATGSLYVRAELDGNLPVSGYIGAGADAGGVLLTLPSDGKTRTHMSVQCDTKWALISLDGGSTWPIYVKPDLAPMRFDGIALAPGTVLKAKNMVAANTAGDIIAHVW
jgi:hypothetical protein